MAGFGNEGGDAALQVFATKRRAPEFSTALHELVRDAEIG